MNKRQSTLPGILFLVCCLFSSYAARTRDEVVQEVEDALSNGAEAAFLKWQAKFNLSYDNSTDEYAFRLRNFLATLAFSHSFNTNHSDVWMGLGPFSHMNASEFSRKHHGYRAGPRQNSTRKLAQTYTTCAPHQYQRVSPIPAAWSWTQQAGVLPPVQDQGECGDCWAFSTTNAVATLTAIVSGKDVVPLSAQAVTSCTSGTTGCTADGCPGAGCGGNPQEGFNYIYLNSGVASSAAYPFVGATSDASYPSLDTPACNVQLSQDVSAKISGYCDVPAQSVAALQSAVAYQPVSVGIAAGTAYWKDYQGGILSSAADCGTDLDHAIIVVGYNTTAPTPYWLLMNQWGTTWGEDGYIQLAMSTSAGPDGVCGVLMDPSIPTTTSVDANLPAPPSPPPSPPAPPPHPLSALKIGGCLLHYHVVLMVASLLCMLLGM